MENTTITIDEAEEILYDDKIGDQEVSQHRWYTKRLIVFKRKGVLWGFYYLAPATEMQEDQDRYEADPVPVFPVVAKTITTTIYGPYE